MYTQLVFLVTRIKFVRNTYIKWNFTALDMDLASSLDGSTQNSHY